MSIDKSPRFRSKTDRENRRAITEEILCPEDTTVVEEVVENEATVTVGSVTLLYGSAGYNTITDYAGYDVAGNPGGVGNLITGSYYYSTLSQDGFGSITNDIMVGISGLERTITQVLFNTTSPALFVTVAAHASEVTPDEDDIPTTVTITTGTGASIGTLVVDFSNVFFLPRNGELTMRSQLLDFSTLDLSDGTPLSIEFS